VKEKGGQTKGPAKCKEEGLGRKRFSVFTVGKKKRVGEDDNSIGTYRLVGGRST
jgi:hypothetical protein